MKALSYLLLTILKNKILSFKRKPAYAILYLFIFGSIVFLTLASKDIQVEVTSYSDIRILYGIVFAIAALFLVLQVSTGLSSGSTLFNMADVGLLFVAPISAKKVLIYGLIKQMGTTILSGIFIFYQIQTLKSSFGLGMKSIVQLIVVYAIVLFFTQLLAISIYILTNGKKILKNIVKYTLILIGVYILLLVYYRYSKLGFGIMESILGLVVIKPFQLLPVVGWSVMLFQGFLEGNLLLILIPLVLYFISSTLMILLFTFGNKEDFYEDVLSYTEYYHSKLAQAKAGKNSIQINKKIKVKEDKTGLSGGRGASTIFYRHLLEKKRTSRFVFVDLVLVIESIAVGIFSYNVHINYIEYIVFGALLYLQIFIVMFGKFNYELTRPYIYLIPAKSRTKIFATSIMSYLKTTVDAVVIFSIVTIVGRTPLINSVFLALAYISSTGLFISYTILCQKLFGGKPSKIISGTFGVLLLIVLLCPALIASGVVIGLVPIHLSFLGTLPFIFVCVVVIIFSLVVFGDILDNSDMMGEGN